MNGFHSAWRGISSPDSASTTGKKSANSTVGNNIAARAVLAHVCLAVLHRPHASPLGDRFADLLRLKQEQPRKLDQVALQVLRPQLDAGARMQLGADRVAVARAVEQRDQQ